MARTVIARSENFFITEEPVETRIDDCDGCGCSNVLCTVEIIDGERFFHCIDCDEIERPIDMTGRCGAVGKWTDDDGDEVTAVCIVFHAEHIKNLHASADLFWSEDYVVQGQS